MAFGVDFKTGTGNSGSLWINCHCLHLGEATQKSVISPSSTFDAAPKGSMPVQVLEEITGVVIMRV